MKGGFKITHFLQGRVLAVPRKYTLDTFLGTI